MVGVGDRDKMVTIEETLAAYRRLPNGRFIVLPDTPHPLEKVSPGRLAREIGDFFLGS
jgi:pimeloyl-ACP methyl ester carboxylesterase